jgi:hypothetical protein
MERTSSPPLHVRSSRRANSCDPLREGHVRDETLKDHCDLALMQPPSIIPSQGGISHVDS